MRSNKTSVPTGRGTLQQKTNIQSKKKKIWNQSAPRIYAGPRLPMPIAEDGAFPEWKLPRLVF